MAVLLLAEVTGGELQLDATSKAVTAAKSLGEITVLAAGAHAADAGAAAAKIGGVAKVLVAEDPSLGHRLAESTAALIVSAVSADGELTWAGFAKLHKGDVEAAGFTGSGPDGLMAELGKRWKRFKEEHGIGKRRKK